MMTHKQSNPNDASALRKRAEEKAKADEAKTLEVLSPEETRRTLHELQVHQIELEMQNEELRLTQERLEALRARYFDLYDLAPVGYFTISEQGLIMEANLTAVTMLDVDRGALVKQLLTRFIIKEDLDIYYRCHKQLFDNGTPQTCELRMVKKDGTQFWAHLEVTIAQDADGVSVCRVALSEIPEREQAYAALKKSEEYFKEITENSSDMIIIADKNGDMKYCSHSIERFTGYKPEELIGKSGFAFIHPDDVQRALSDFGKAVLTKETEIPNAFRIVHKDGSERYFDGIGRNLLDNPAVAGFVMNIRDVTDRKKMEESLRALSSRQQALLAAIPDIIVEVDKNKVFTWTNPVGLEFYGEDVLGKEAAFYFEGKQDTYSIVAPLFGGSEEVVYVESWQRRKDGEKRLLAWWCRALKDGGGNVIGTLSTARDITELKQAEETLRNSEENFHRSQDDSPLGIRIITFDGKILYANQAILDIYGYDSVEELKTTPHKKNYTTESYAEHQVRKEKRQRGEYVPPNYEMSIIRKDGEVRYLEIFRKEVLWNGEPQFQVLHNDITERRWAEEELQESEEKFRALVEHGLEGILVTDLQGTILFANNATARTVESDDCDGLIGRNVMEFIAPESREDVVGDFIQVAQGHDAFLTQYSAISAKGNKFYVESIGKVISYEGKPADLLSIRDITKRKQAEEALRESEEKHRTLFETMAQGVLYQAADGEIISANPNAKLFLGLTLTQLQERTSIDPRLKTIHEDGSDFPPETHPAMIALKTGRKVLNTVMGVYNPKDNIQYWINVNATPQFKPGENEPYQVYTTFEDITKQKQAEEALLASLEEKEILLREVHHRVKNNLAAIIALMEMQRKTLGESAMTAALSALENRIKSMALVHERLYRSQNLSQIDFQDYLSALVSHLRTSMNTPRDLRFSINAEGITFDLNVAVPVGMIVNELVINALKYAFPDNRPRCGADQCEITISLEREGAECTLTVDDNGIGLPESFDLTATSTLGLRLVKMLGAHQLGGKLTLNRTRGTHFVLKFNTEQKG